MAFDFNSLQYLKQSITKVYEICQWFRKYIIQWHTLGVQLYVFAEVTTAAVDIIKAYSTLQTELDPHSQLNSSAPSPVEHR